MTFSVRKMKVNNHHYVNPKPGDNGFIDSCNQMGMEVLEGLRVFQSQQRRVSRKINKRINSHPVSTLAKKRIDRLRLEHLALLCGNKDLTFPSSPYQRCFGRDRRKICVCLGEDL